MPNLRIGHPGMTQGEADAWVRANPVKDTGLCNPESSCKACRGRHRGHKRTLSTCIYNCLTPAQCKSVKALLKTDSVAAWEFSYEAKAANALARKRGARGTADPTTKRGGRKKVAAPIPIHVARTTIMPWWPTRFTLLMKDKFIIHQLTLLPFQDLPQLYP